MTTDQPAHQWPDDVQFPAVPHGDDVPGAGDMPGAGEVRGAGGVPELPGDPDGIAGAGLRALLGLIGPGDACDLLVLLGPEHDRAVRLRQGGRGPVAEVVPDPEPDPAGGRFAALLRGQPRG